jgi:hypothetical protein
VPYSPFVRLSLYFYRWRDIWQGASGKIEDFVIATGKPSKSWQHVELGEGTHTAQADRPRDTITKAVGYQTIRYQAWQKRRLWRCSSMRAQGSPSKVQAFFR